MAGSMASAVSYSSLSSSAIAARKQILYSQSASRITWFRNDVAKGVDMGMLMGIGRRTGCGRDGRSARAMSAVDRKESGISSSTDSRSLGFDRKLKGWIDESGNENVLLVAQVRSIAAAARDHAELHSIIGVQRDNWNKLCLNTVVTATVAAAVLAAINSASSALSPGLAVTAFLLNGGTAALMFLAGKLQPSQLAEEQRSAARQLKALAEEIDTTLQIDPRLREDAELFLDDKLTRLQAVDRAYPLPLTPDGLPKFPKVVRPSIVSAQVDLSTPEMPHNNSNGWTDAIATDLKQTAEKVRSADKEMYLARARKKERENLRLAIPAPILATAAALFNALECFAIGNHVYMCSIAAVCSVLAMFAFGFSQGGQIGMVFEMFRDCAGSYTDIDNIIQRAIRLPVSHREDGELTHFKIALQLGRLNEVPMVRPGDETAGKVF